MFKKVISLLMVTSVTPKYSASLVTAISLFFEGIQHISVPDFGIDTHIYDPVI